MSGAEPVPAGSLGGGADTAYVGLGSNLGESEVELSAAADLLVDLASRTERSSLYRTAPVGGPPGQSDYLNAVVALIEPRLSPHELLSELLAIEAKRGRVRAERWGPRVIDLDLLAYGQVSIDDPILSLPHPRLHHRAFVLAPLCELAPQWRHPDIGETACALLARLPPARVERLARDW